MKTEGLKEGHGIAFAGAAERTAESCDRRLCRGGTATSVAQPTRARDWEEVANNNTMKEGRTRLRYSLVKNAAVLGSGDFYVIAYHGGTHRIQSGHG